MGGDGGGRILSKLGIVLTAIFVISLFMLLAQLFYSLWRRRVFRRQTRRGCGVGEDTNNLSVYSSSESTFSSKELLYFFCMRPPHSSSIAAARDDDPNTNRQLDMEVVDIDLLKLQGMFGPPRFLFTIKEGEREGFESPVDKPLHSAEKEAKKVDEFNVNNRMSLEECFKAADSVVEVEIDGGGGDDATPFATPCASPLFFTPSASPAHSVINIPLTEEIGICSECKTGE